MNDGGSKCRILTVRDFYIPPFARARRMGHPVSLGSFEVGR
jgi:hypothetical protein